MESEKVYCGKCAYIFGIFQLEPGSYFMASLIFMSHIESQYIYLICLFFEQTLINLNNYPK